MHHTPIHMYIGAAPQRGPAAHPRCLLAPLPARGLLARLSAQPGGGLWRGRLRPRQPEEEQRRLRREAKQAGQGRHKGVLKAGKDEEDSEEDDDEGLAGTLD